jgi:hypothetical protein
LSFASLTALLLLLGLLAADYQAALNVYEGMGVRDGEVSDKAAAAAAAGAAAKQQQDKDDSSQAAAAAAAEDEDPGGGGEEDVETPAVAPAPAKVG